MPVEFLTRQQRQRLGRFNQDPTPEQLAGCFHLDDADRTLIDRRTRDRARLGFAVQLGTLRYLGTFLPDPTEVPTVVVDYLARQLRISDPSVLKGYGEGETRWDHASEIRRIYGYSDFFDEPGHAELRQWVEARAWTMGERPGVLFDLATAWLLQRRVVLPGATVLERFIASIHEGATNRLWVTLAAAPTPQVLQLLEELLVVPEGSRRSSFDRLRQAPRAPTAAGMVSALRRLEEVRALHRQGTDGSCRSRRGASGPRHRCLGGNGCPAAGHTGRGRHSGHDWRFHGRAGRGALRADLRSSSS